MKSALKITTRVRSIGSYLDEFEQGVFQVPSFQREFLWSNDDIIELFVSIKNKYPIGSIQFWQPIYKDSEVWIEQENNYIGPYKVLNTNSEPKPIFILDGLQRLSSLFGCLINPEKYNEDRLKLNESLWNDKFRIFYDLDKEEFFILRKNQKNTLRHQVPLYALISTSDYRKFARENIESIEDKAKSELYNDRADELSKIILNYEISSVDILNASIDEAVDIFWRVNKKGIQISKDWIVNALTNTNNFSLKSEIDSLYEKLEIYNFKEINRELIFNCIQSSFGKLSFEVDVVNLIKADKNKFIDQSKKTISSIEEAISFLFNKVYVIDNKLLPTIWHLIFVTEFFNILEKPTHKHLEDLKEWFWFTAYSNYFTVYSPSKRQKAFQQFRDYLFGHENEMIYIENRELKFQVPKYKPSNFGSVRYCANVLFQLSQTQEDITPQTCLGFSSIKLIEGEKKNLANIIFKPNMVNDKLLYYQEKKQTSLQFLLSSEFRGLYTEFFITDKMLDLYVLKKNNELLKERQRLIEEKENEFITKVLKLELE